MTTPTPETLRDRLAARIARIHKRPEDDTRPRAYDYLVADVAMDEMREALAEATGAGWVCIRWAYEDDPAVQNMPHAVFDYLYRFSRLSDMPHGGVRLYPILEPIPPITTDDTKETPCT